MSKTRPHTSMRAASATSPDSSTTRGQPAHRRNAKLRSLLTTLNQNLTRANNENRSLRRSFEGARANVKRERNLTQIFCQ